MVRINPIIRYLDLLSGYVSLPVGAIVIETASSPARGMLHAYRKLECMDEGKKVRIIACGNPYMGNDGIGVRIMAEIQRDHPAIDIVDGGIGGLGLIPLMEGYDRIIIVDATCGAGPLGMINIFTDPPPSSLFPMSLHDIGIAETLTIAREIGISADIIIIGIEGGDIEEFSTSMDPEVEGAIENATRLVLDAWKKR